MVSNESLAQLAKLAITKRPPPAFRGAPAAKNRAAFFVGSGVFAATTAAVLTFFMVSANNSVKHPKLPVMASITQPVPNKVFPWQPETQQPTRQAAFMRSEAPASAVADLEAEAEAASESPDGDPDHPGPPPPYSPPPPSEPPSAGVTSAAGGRITTSQPNTADAEYVAQTACQYVADTHA